MFTSKIGSNRLVVQNRLLSVQLLDRWSKSSKYSSDSTLQSQTDQNVQIDPNLSQTDCNSDRPKTITEQFTAAMNSMTERKEKHRKSSKKSNDLNNTKVYFRGLTPIDEEYTTRFQYNGYLKNSHWKYYDENRPLPNAIESEEQYNYRIRKKRTFCLLLGFAGGNYYGMQYNLTTHTIEDEIFSAMLKNNWILPEHVKKPWQFDFQRGSRTDRGVSAARMNVSAILPIDVSIEDLNRDLPSDIRMFGMKRVTPKFNARLNCSARTYSYTLPTIALSHYNDQTPMNEYRVPADRLQRANEILSLFKGHTNFHNYTTKQLFFDRSSSRFIYHIDCGEPFMEHDIEFARITVKGSSFMLHQIRKMVGFSLAVIRGVVDDDLLQRSLTKERFNTPMAPGLGLMLERLHFDSYADKFKMHDPLTFDEFDEAVEKFRREKIHPFIVETEIKEHSMHEWLELLMIHSFNADSRDIEEERRYHDDPVFDDEWGESPEFLEKLKKQSEK